MTRGPAAQSTIDAVSLLDQAVERARPMLLAEAPIKDRVRLFWAACKMAGGLAAADVVDDTFIKFAVEVNLIDEHGRWITTVVGVDKRGEPITDIAKHRIRYGRTDIAHVVRWALRGWNPFESGPLT
jgi:hypothetical protein